MKKLFIRMPKFICLIFCSFLACSIFCLSDETAASLALPIYQDFETPSTYPERKSSSAYLPDDWDTTKTSIMQWGRVDIDDNGGDTTAVLPHSSSSWMAITNVYSASPSNSDLLYTMDSFSFPTEGYCEFSFYMYHYPDTYIDTDNVYGTPGKEWGLLDSVTPQISTDGGITWNNLCTPITRVNGTTGWAEHTISVPSAVYGGPSVMLGLRSYADGGYNMYIDDISIYSTTPVDLTATPGNGNVVLDWDNVKGATGYKVYKSTTAGSDYSEVDPGVAKTVSSYTVSGLENGTTYYFVVTATTSFSSESAYSAYATATPISTIPDPPTGLTATEGNGQVTLSWNSVDGATSYNIYQSTTSGSGYSEVDPGVAKTDPSYTVTGLDNSVQYYFVITVTTAGGTSAYSNELMAMSSVPLPPSNFRAVAGDEQVTLSWDSVPGANSYKVYQSTASGGGYTEIDPGILKTDTSYTVTGLTNDTPYYFVVKAHRSEDSSYSNEVCCKPLKIEAPSGSGTPADPYIIDGPNDLIWMSSNISTVKASCFKQTANLDMNGVDLIPIGNTTHIFSGTYDGCARNISNLTITSSSNRVGLFHTIGDGGTVKNLTLTNASIRCTCTGIGQVGALAGAASGTIEGCNVVGNSSIESVNQTSGGGLIGSFSVGSIKNCYSMATITITGDSPYSSLGGILGEITNSSASDSSVQSCYFAGSITGTAANKGGITGLAYGNYSLSENYFLDTTATNGIGSTASDNGASPASDADLKQQFPNWDYNAVWYLDTGNAYPVLRTPAPNTSNISITVNPEGTEDTLSVSGVTANDIVKVYNASDAADPIVSTTVLTGPSSNAVSIGKLHAGSGSVYVSLTSSTRAESSRTRIGIPSAPTGVTAIPGNQHATVTFSAPASDGGSAITGYTVTSDPAGGIDGDAGSTSLSHVVTGLTNGTAYTFTVTAANSVGTSPASAPSAPVTPYTDSTITPTTAVFDKNVSAQADIAVTMTLNGNTLSSITNGGSALVMDTDYTVSGSTVTILKSYLAAQPAGTVTLTFNFSSGNPQILTVTISDSTVNNSTITPTTAVFDKNVSAQADIAVTMTLNGNTLSSITNGGSALVMDTDYTVAGSTVTILKSYLAAQPAGTVTLTFNFSSGSPQTLTVNVSDSTVSNSTITPTTAVFDKNVSAQADIAVTMTLNGNTLSSITNGGSALVMDTDYTVSGSTVTILKSYLAAQPAGTVTLTFNFSSGNPQILTVTISDSTVNNSTITPTTAVFDKNVSAQADIAVTMTLNGNTLSSITNGGSALVMDTDYTVAGSTVTILKSYLAAQPVGTLTLTFNFSAGSPQTLTITISHSTSGGHHGSGGGTSGSSGSTGTTAPSTDAPSNSGSVVVNGNSMNAGSLETQTSNGQNVTTLTVDPADLNDILAAAGNNTTLIVPITGADVAIGMLNGQMIEDMQSQQITLEIRTDSASYTLPASEIDIGALSDQFGPSFNPAELVVQIQIAQPPAETIELIENTAAAGEFTIIAPPVNFTISCTYNNQTVDLSNFSSFVERAIQIPEGVDPYKVTTGIIVNLDGTVRHVPTKIEQKDGRYYAVLNSMTNSTYLLIRNMVDFTDVSAHWAKAAINDMGSRMIVTGVGNNNYAPDRDITRAEFAVIVVKALGLEIGKAKNKFRDDVRPSDWYYGYIETANAFGIINGYSETAFGPQDKITREQSMAIIANAMKIAGLKSSIVDGDTDDLLAGFADAGNISGYAKNSVALCLKAGIVTGRNSNIIAPQDYITRAETAAIVQRLLQESQLI